MKDAYRAEKIVSQKKLLGEDYTHIGVIGVDEQGQVEILREARKLDINKDIKFYRYELRRVENSLFDERIYVSKQLS